MEDFSDCQEISYSSRDESVKHFEVYFLKVKSFKKLIAFKKEENHVSQLFARYLERFFIHHTLMELNMEAQSPM